MGSDIYIADTGRGRILKNGEVIAGKTEKQIHPKIKAPKSFTFSKKGELFILDSGQILLLEKTGDLRVFDWGYPLGRTTGTPQDITMGSSDNEFYVLTTEHLFRFRK